jgi:hypothetical protein
VATEDLLQGAMESLGVQRAGQPDGVGDVVDLLVRGPLVQEPQPLLGEGQRQAVLAARSVSLTIARSSGGDHLGLGWISPAGEALGEEPLDFILGQSLYL